ncbi:NadS family protein, partial [Enterobacter hormaechei]
MSIFNELKSSLEAAVEIHNGRQAASRVTRYEVADVRAIR